MEIGSRVPAMLTGEFVRWESKIESSEAPVTEVSRCCVCNPCAEKSCTQEDSRTLAGDIPYSAAASAPCTTTSSPSAAGTTLYFSRNGGNA